MKISYNWLKDFIHIEHTPEQIADLLTQSGLEVEGLEHHEAVKGGLKGVVLGKVLTCGPHPNADKLKVTTVDVGGNILLPIVCGAPNVEKGQKVVVATPGSTLFPSGAEKGFKIKKAKIRGEVSEGMICAEDELGIGANHDGILVLDTDMPVGTPAADFFNLEDDYVFEIGLTPNRADAASHFGVARDLRALIHKEIRKPIIDEFNVDNQDLYIPVFVENTEACPRYSALTISGIEVKPSPEWLQNRLRTIGIAPINNIVDVTNYVLFELGQPLHAFDANNIKGKKVVVKTLNEGTSFTTLDEKERKLSSSDLMICDAEGGMCIAGVFGGVESGIVENTKNVFLESAYFSPDHIRKTSMHHGLKTDAAFRFERGTDPEITVFALKRAALLIKKLAGGQISSEVIDVYPEPVQPLNISMKFANIDRLIGKSIGKEKIFEILNSLDILVEQQDEQGFIAVVPPYRVDVTREADVIEEILRIYGYDNVELKPYLSAGYLADFPAFDKEKGINTINELLASIGFYEIITNSLTKPSYHENIKGVSPEEDVRILNKLSEDLGVMRQSLVFGGLEVIAHNINRKQKNLKIFELGRTYHKKAAGYEEKEILALWGTGNAEEENWQSESRKLEFHDFFAGVHKIINKFKGDSYSSAPFKNEFFSYGVELSADGHLLATIGKLHPVVTGKVHVEQDIFYAEVNLEALFLEADKSFTFKEISKLPEVRRDLSLVIDKNVTFEQIKNVTRQKEFDLLKRVNVFDYYEGDKIDESKKAYALGFILQDDRKTLTDKVIDKVMDRLIQVYEKELGAVIRK
jgi:phenylalanyl-tRNA synthetase beta chain